MKNSLVKLTVISLLGLGLTTIIDAKAKPAASKTISIHNNGAVDADVQLLQQVAKSRSSKNPNWDASKSVGTVGPNSTSVFTLTAERYPSQYCVVDPNNPSSANTWINYDGLSDNGMMEVNN